MEQKTDVLNEISQKEAEIHQKAQGSENTAEDVAAQLFALYHPLFTQHVAKLSNRQLRRLINALVKFPVEMENYAPTKEVEKNAFLIGDRLLQSKYVMMIFTAQQSMDQVKLEDVVNKPEEQKEESKGE